MQLLHVKLKLRNALEFIQSVILSLVFTYLQPVAAHMHTSVFISYSVQVCCFTCHMLFSFDLKKKKKKESHLQFLCESSVSCKLLTETKSSLSFVDINISVSCFQLNQHHISFEFG